MSKFDVFLIISQIYLVGSLIGEKNRTVLNFFAVLWIVLMFIAMGAK